MGQQLMRRPPKYVHGYIDRHGKARFYFRRAGFKKIALPGLPWSPSFMAAYEAALHGEPAPRLEAGISRTKPGTVAATVAGYFGSLAFSTLAETTRLTRRRMLERFREEHGEKGIATLGRVHVERMVRAKASQPGTALNFLVALRGLMRHAIAAGLRADDPTTGVQGPKFRSAGFYSWTESDIAAFEAQASDRDAGSSCIRALAVHSATTRRCYSARAATPPGWLVANSSE